MSTGVNVLRYSALVLGGFYGFSHQQTLTAAHSTAKVNHEYEHKQSLIEKAKKEFTKQNDPNSGKSSGVVSNPDDPKFDLEKWIKSVSGEK